MEECRGISKMVAQSVLKACIFTELEERIFNSSADFDIKILEEETETGQLLDKHKNCSVFVEGVKIFRQVFKRRYRGVYYLTPKVLLETNAYADQRIKEFLQENLLDDQQRLQIEQLLAKQIELDRKWIEDINSSRRDLYLGAIKQDVLECCQEKMRNEYLNLYSDLVEHNIMYLEENALSLQLNGWRQHFLKEFQNQIPFSEEEDSSSIAKLSNDLLASLNSQVFDPLVLKNLQKVQNLSDQINELVDKSVAEYTQNVKKGLRKLKLSRIQAILKLHKTNMKKFLPSEKDNKFGGKSTDEINEKCEVFKKYQNKCVETLEKLLKEKSDLAQSKFESFQTEVNTEITKFLANFKTISKKCKCIPSSSLGKMKDVMETCLGEITLSTETTNENAVESIMNLVKNQVTTQSKTKLVSPNVTNKEISKLVSTFENNYTERLAMLLKTKCGLAHLQRFHKFETEVIVEIFGKEYDDQKFNNIGLDYKEKLFLDLKIFTEEHFKQVVGLVCSAKKDNEKIISTVPPYNALTPLAIMVSPSGIQMATTNDCFIIKNEFGESKTMPRVGYTKNGQFIYGEDLANQLKFKNEKNAVNYDLLYNWLLFEYNGKFHSLCKTLEPDTVKIGEKQEKITVEFLLAFILRKLKISADIEMEEFAKTVVISVPFYLCSVDRIKIKDAAKLAGFLEVTLVNDCAASLYAAWPRNCQYAAIFSQSAKHYITCFLYKAARKYDDNENMIVSNAEIYKMQSFKTINMKKAFGCKKTGKWMLENAYEEMLENVVKPTISVGMFITWENEDSETTNILKEFYNELVLNSDVGELDNLVLRGTAQLSNSFAIRDKLSQDICVGSEKFLSGLLLSKKSALETIIANLRLGACRVPISNGKEIGNLFLTGIARCGPSVELRIRINHEGIVFLEGIKSYMEINISPEIMKSLIEWEVANFTQKEMEYQWKLLNLLGWSDGPSLNDTLSSFETVCTIGYGNGVPIATSSENK